jgi:mRNA interferase MazF
MSPAEPRRGEVWWIALDPSVGGEIRKTRPAVVVSNGAANRALNRIQVVPLTSKIAKVYPAQAAVTLEGRQSKAATDQIATASKLRLRGRIARLDLIDVAAVDRAIRTQLALQRLRPAAGRRRPR